MCFILYHICKPEIFRWPTILLLNHKTSYIYKSFYISKTKFWVITHVTSISHWENHTSKASYWSGRAQVIIRSPSQGDLPDVGFVILPPLSKARVPTAALCLRHFTRWHFTQWWFTRLWSAPPPVSASSPSGWPTLNESTICYEHKSLGEPHPKS